MPLRRNAFTLIELLIVVSIIGILIAGIAVAVTKAKEFANNNDQKANLKNLTIACRVMETQHHRLPPAWAHGYGRPPVQPGMGLAVNSTAPGVFVSMLPFLENKPLYDGNAFSGASVPVYHSRMDPSLPAQVSGHTSFVANIRVFSTFGSTVPFDAPVPMATTPASGWDGHYSTEKILDGAGNTVLFTTKYARCNQQDNLFHAAPHDSLQRGPYFGGGNYAGETNRPNASAPSAVSNPVVYQIAPSLAATSANWTHCNNDRGIFGHSFGTMGLAVAMGDTSVRNLSFSVCGEAYALALCPSDGLPMDADWW